MSIFEFVKSLDSIRRSDQGMREDIVAWLEALAGSFASVDLDSKLGSVRKRWTLDAIESVAKVHQPQSE